MISVYCDVLADLDVSISLKISLEKFKIILKFFNICFRSWDVLPGQTTFYISVHRIPMYQDIVGLYGQQFVPLDRDPTQAGRSSPI